MRWWIERLHTEGWAFAGYGIAVMLLAGVVVMHANQWPGPIDIAVAAPLALLAALLAPVFLGFARLARDNRSIVLRTFDLVESLPGAVFQIRSWPDGRTRCELASSNVLRVRGITADEALRDPSGLIDTILESDRPMVLNALASGEDGQPMQMDFRVRRPGDEEIRWIRTVAAARLQADGSTLWSGNWEDVTSQKALEVGLLRALEDAGAASRAKDRFLATVSHEIRTPMNGVLALLELLSLSTLDDDQVATLDTIRQSGESLLRIIDDILDFSKIEAGKLGLVPRPTDISRLLRRVVDMHLGSASAKGLRIELETDAGLAAAHQVDPVRLEQIANNLIGNAIKFTAEGSICIRIGAARRDLESQLVHITVKDSGIGMSSAHREHVFEAFTQAHAEIFARYGGTGLGLTICRRLAEMMDGTIQIQSREGAGTEVTVSLPLPVAVASIAEPCDVRVGPDSDCRANGPGERQRVLVVDDHPVNRMVMVRQVTTLGYDARPADSGEAALAMWRTGRFAAVMTDCNMPGMDGYGLARAIREEERAAGQPRTPVIACTANALAGEAEKCIAVGMDDYLAKPVQLLPLSKTLARWICAMPVDRLTIAALSGGKPAVEQRIFSLFRDYNDRDCASLRDMVFRRNRDAAIEVCHRIKGAAGTIGATEIAATSVEVASAARENDWPAAERALSNLENAVSRLRAYIESQGDRRG
jgi:two-component system sensor histidine kinase EvgS